MTRALTLLLGIYESEYGHLHLETQHQERTACAISVGSDTLSPARLHKARHDVPNEDAALAIDDGPLTLIAVADAHFGHEASHDLLTQIAELADPIPRNPLDALELLLRVEPRKIDQPSRSESTLLLAILDRDQALVHGYSFGDSSLVALTKGQAPELLNTHNSIYIQPQERESLDPRGAREFSARLSPDTLLLAYTDGIDSCHYNHPESSITLAHIQRLNEDHPDPAGLLEALGHLALEGIPPHPGGQDNIAAICTNLASS